MGWTYSYGATRKDVIKDVTRTQSWVTQDGVNAKLDTIKHAVRGNVLWAIQQSSTEKDGVVCVQDRFIVCYLLGKNKNCGWGYKDMDESMGPFYYSCPLSFLKETPVVNQKWRDNVIAYHNNCKPSFKLKVGQLVALKQGWQPTSMRITSVKPLRGYNGSINYRIPRRAIDKVLENV